MSRGQKHRRSAFWGLLASVVSRGKPGGARRATRTSSSFPRLENPVFVNVVVLKTAPFKDDRRSSKDFESSYPKWEANMIITQRTLHSIGK